MDGFELAGQAGKLKGLSRIGIVWLERLEKLDPKTTTLENVNITLKSLKENLEEISEISDQIDYSGN